MIEVTNLTKAYGETLAVDDLTFTVRPGIVTGFLGPNGAGKSTTIRMIMSIISPDAGAVEVKKRWKLAHGAQLSCLDVLEGHMHTTSLTPRQQRATPKVIF